MRVYHKGRHHQITIHLTSKEVDELLEESEGVDPDFTPIWAKLTSRVKTAREGPTTT